MPAMHYRPTTCLLLGLGFALVANAPCEAAGDAAKGAALAQGWCSKCHALAPGQESPNPKAPRFPAVANEPTATTYALRVFLKTPHSTMPDFKIPPDQIDDLVAFIHSLRR
jgi:mono/diheme cytochrome c family protein